MEVVFKGLAKFSLLSLFLQLRLCFGTGAAAALLVGHLRLVPLLVVFDVVVRRRMGRHFHPCLARNESVNMSKNKPLSCGRPTLQTLSLICTLLAVVELVVRDVLILLLAVDDVVGDVAVGVGGRLPLENDLGGGVGPGNGVQRYRGSCYTSETERDDVASALRSRITSFHESFHSQHATGLT